MPHIYQVANVVAAIEKDTLVRAFNESGQNTTNLLRTIHQAGKGPTCQPSNCSCNQGYRGGHTLRAMLQEDKQSLQETIAELQENENSLRETCMYLSEVVPTHLFYTCSLHQKICGHQVLR
ncbi:hypothetical protein O6H91_Y203000 [Diphasiastrum complanatum]|nr:hypothetical protein O6H91_Y203000 [Diphasiastrum complanatum]